MATAILTVLYPTEFSVYDVRVCKQLNDFKGLAGLQFSERLRQEFQRYLGAVHSAAPKGLSLRDKDRYLWGRSFYEGVLKDLRNVKRDREGGKRRDDQAGDELAAGHCLSSHHPRFWTFRENRIAVRFAYEWHDDSFNWFRSYGNKNWEFQCRRPDAAANSQHQRPADRWEFQCLVVRATRRLAQPSPR
jgi:Protein of unknown function (DUF1348)